MYPIMRPDGADISFTEAMKLTHVCSKSPAFVRRETTSTDPLKALANFGGACT